MLFHVQRYNWLLALRSHVNYVRLVPRNYPPLQIAIIWLQRSWPAIWPIRMSCLIKLFNTFFKFQNTRIQTSSFFHNHPSSFLSSSLRLMRLVWLVCCPDCCWQQQQALMAILAFVDVYNGICVFCCCQGTSLTWLVGTWPRGTAEQARLFTMNSCSASQLCFTSKDWILFFFLFFFFFFVSVF